ncbi:RNA methyltransferase [Anaerolinea sp.]|uniref:TrmH family RNA methyltransferase n=1 Tax=Anaerolinea sp. TaxID=1872519 RepID=UPI002ACE3947|nr:RNA methyltransferase [Anaerolinea sp.]
MPVEKITSIHNPRIQTVRALLSRREERRERGWFVAEGVRLVEEGVQAGWQTVMALYSADLSARGQTLLSMLHAQGAEMFEVPSSLLKQVSDTETPQGILAVFARQDYSLPDPLDFVVIADNLRDPGNLGTLLRSAAAAGAQTVWLTPGTVDAFSPKVLRAGMGAHFRLPVQEVSLEWIRDFRHQRPNMPFYLAEAENGTPCWDTDLTQPLVLVIGGEAEGASPEMRALVNGNITIPMPGRSESLNAAVAAGILLFEVVRQRRQAP